MANGCFEMSNNADSLILSLEENRPTVRKAKNGRKSNFYKHMTHVCFGQAPPAVN